VPLVPDPVRIRCQAGRNQADSRSCGRGAARAGGHSVVGADCQHIAHLALADAAAQLTAAVDFVAGYEGGADPQRLRMFQEGGSQLRLGGEQYLLRHAGQLAVLLIRHSRSCSATGTLELPRLRPRSRNIITADCGTACGPDIREYAQYGICYRSRQVRALLQHERTCPSAAGLRRDP
jgi:hypothetical protein